MSRQDLLSRLALGVLSWAAMLGLWLLLVDSSAIPEVVAGLGVAVIGAVVADIVRSRREMHFRPRPHWIGYAWQLPWRVAVDCGIVMAALWRCLVLRQRVEGRLRVLPFPTGGDDPESRAWRAFTLVATSVAPNTYVIGYDRGRGVVIVHQLVPSDPNAVRKSVVGTL
jgi:multisubunit Na+/H+ antiporter MnhE subunit